MGVGATKFTTWGEFTPGNSSIWRESKVTQVQISTRQRQYAVLKGFFINHFIITQTKVASPRYRYQQGQAEDYHGDHPGHSIHYLKKGGETHHQDLGRCLGPQNLPRKKERKKVKTRQPWDWSQHAHPLQSNSNIKEPKNDFNSCSSERKEGMKNKETNRQR